VNESKNIVILGSTGSIGTAALEVIAALGSEYKISGLAANTNWQFGPDMVAIADPQHHQELTDALADTDVQMLAGSDGICQMAASRCCNFVICAILGAESIRPTIAAVQSGKTLGLASKEALVVAGSLIMPLARGKSVPILPIDSEHNAIFQAMQAGQRHHVQRVILTASGGPFRDWPADRMYHATLEQALEHPTWTMGRKITIDSATMMNKALEIIEACWLFDLAAEQVEVLIHSESIIHSLVQFVDGSVVAQMSYPDMRMPIQHALTYPQRLQSLTQPLDLADVGRMTFSRPAGQHAEALRLGHQVAQLGGTAGAVLNAANEAAVDAFVDGAIPFGRIVELTDEILQEHHVIQEPTLEQLLQADQWARNEVNVCLNC